ncbi:ATP-dependent DNA ligase [Microbacterium sp. LWO14-1.2]|uniref:DUF7882 family protein n=1 Tax=Microbacterium sp. LWO14-1.2 TaxID=3135263 RepID=UPI0031391DFC
MGRLNYEHEAHADFDDRALTHLQIVIMAKLRRGEPFMFTWINDAREGGGRTTAWLHPKADLVFRFQGSAHPDINRAWIEALTEAANSPAGLRLLPEPTATPVATASR